MLFGVYAGIIIHLTMNGQIHLESRVYLRSSRSCFTPFCCCSSGENAGSVWPSSVGNAVGVSTHASVIRKVGAGYGADRPVSYIQGREWTAFTFGKVIPTTFTLCSITRYTGTVGVGEPRGRILQFEESNYLHGHWHDNIGVAHYHKWVTHHDWWKTNLEWVVLCGTNGAKRVYEMDSRAGIQDRRPRNIATDQGAVLTSDNTLVINRGQYSGENSAYAAMEVITWNRALSDAEMVMLVLDKVGFHCFHVF